ncbi:hypothetical protein MOV08_03650 [Streptomyces yunnanensis]|uniref:Peptidase inhibitor family I36 n=1 Tax=Streptomyces yunnanensis TaxID=156453 RepID=A0ABY8A4K9_9ACTN|nr:hypothetical protein [Streptomyces yunnanensis]WEB38487.1 hypothetical protein MOV08_03650 [Streptomyces yunnanensis]
MTLRKLTAVASLLAAGLLAVTAPAVAAAPAKYPHAAAAQQFREAGVAWTSSGRCSDRNNRSCTSFEQINRTTVAGVIAFKRASRCAVTVTAGTEKGHQEGRYSHWNGYKVDVHVTPCVDRYIAGHFRYTGRRPGDGAKTYKSPAGNVYAREVARSGTHWDITYFNGNR